MLFFALCAMSGAAAADWREKLREGSHASVAARPVVEPPQGRLSYSGSYRSGITSNANEDFDEKASGYVQSEQELLLKRAAGEAVLGLQLRGSIDAAFAAGDIDYGDLESRGSVAWRTLGTREMALIAGYRMEHDSGFRSHDLGMTLETRKPVGRAVQFTTFTVNEIVHEPQSFSGISLERDDSDRLRLGVESGIELPAYRRITPSLSLGVVDVTHDRALDYGGYRRDSLAGFVRAAARLGGEGRLGGAFGVMAFHRRYDEPGYSDRALLLPEAELKWRAGDRTSLSFSYLADLEETPIYGASNLHTVTMALKLTRKFGGKRSVSAFVYRERGTYLEASADEVSQGAGLEYARKLDERLALSLSGEYERITGTGYLEDVEIWKLSLGFGMGYAK